MTEPPSLNDLAWIAGLERAKVSVRYSPVALHCYTKLRNAEGVAPVVLELENCCYVRVPANLEAAFELTLRHLNQKRDPWPVTKTMTIQNFLADRATEALKLPGCFIPTTTGEILKLDEPTEPSLPLEIDVLSTPEHANMANPVISPDIGSQNADNNPIGGCESEEDYNTDIAASINAVEPQSELPHLIDDATVLPTAPNVGLGQQNVVPRPTNSKRDRRRASQQARRMR